MTKLWTGQRGRWHYLVAVPHAAELCPAKWLRWQVGCCVYLTTMHKTQKEI